MKRWSAARLLLVLFASIGVWVVVAALCLTVGSTGINWPAREVREIRQESVLLASLVGAALALAGVTYQAILRNPLADPYLLGISSGASLAAYLWRFRYTAALATSLLGAAGAALSQQVFAFVGALLAVVVVFGLASRRGKLEPITLLLVGVIVNAVNGALFLLLNALYQDMPGSGGALAFLVGGIQTNLESQQIWTAAGVLAAGFVVLMSIAGKLNVAGVSDVEAESLGVGIHRLRWTALVTASLVTAAGVAVSGPIGFIGLVCPHLARLVVGRDHRKLIPIATALGAALLAVADAASRRLAAQSLAQTLLPVGVLTGLIGGPFFLFLLWQDRRRAREAEAGW
jgi:iron complex transport system permease protein